MRVLPGIVLTILSVGSLLGLAQESLPPLVEGKAPQTFEEMWTGFDPKSEPLEVEVLKQWEEDEVLMKVLRYRIGIFKGQKAMMAAVYGYPKGGRALPGLVQIHGGGQYADHKAVLTNGKRGYATISIAWAGRISAPDYKVTPKEVQLFWDDARNNPNYKVTTDWGALDAYHAPCRNPKNAFAHVSPAAWTLDAVDSPRNNPWFLCTLGARRAITFLEEQPEVDREKLGVYGHSMGGKLTVMTAATDKRLKAAVPSCGGVSNNPDDHPLYAATIADRTHLSQIQCPVLFLKPANDFHGHLSDAPEATRLIKNKDWRVVTSAHHNHQDHGEFEVSGLLWFDQHLKGSFTFPKTPKSALHLDTDDKVPSFTVKPDTSKPILEVDVYYTQQGDRSSDRDRRMNRHWHYAKATKHGDTWTAKLPIASTDEPLWAYANVRYALKEPITGAGYYYRVYTTESFNNSTLIQIASIEQLKQAKVTATLTPSLNIETFEGDTWEKAWFSYRPEEWPRRTHKIYTPLWSAPKEASLALEIRSDQANKFVLGLDTFAAEVSLNGGTEWQTIELKPAHFLDASSKALESWDGLKELRLGAKETLRIRNGSADTRRIVGADWKGNDPTFRKLRWIAEAQSDPQE